MVFPPTSETGLSNWTLRLEVIETATVKTFFDWCIRTCMVLCYNVLAVTTVLIRLAIMPNVQHDLFVIKTNLNDGW